MNPVFLILVVSMLAGAALSWRRLRAEQAQRTRRGPVPGYSRTDGAEMTIDPGVDAVAQSRWRPLWLETLHAPDRSRIVVTLHLRDLSRAEAAALAEQLACDVQARSHVRVVLVRADRSSSVTLRHLYAPDGRGWTGRGHHSRLTCHP